MDPEKLHFKVTLSGTPHHRSPEFQIGLDGVDYVTGLIPSYNGVSTLYEFYVEGIQPGDHALTISFVNKVNTDTVLDANGNIVEDLLLNIEKIEIDDIDMGNLIWSNSVYTPDYPKSYAENMRQQGITLDPQITECVNLGWNGQWTFPFTSPFYFWMLENV